MSLRVRLAASLVFVLVMLSIAMPAAAQAAPTDPPSPPASVTPTPDPSTTSGTAEDPGFFDVGGRVGKAINDWFADLATSALNPVLDLLGRTVLATPDFTVQSKVRDLWGVSAGIANSFFVIMVIVAGAILMGHETVQSSYSVKDLAPRVVFGFIAANLSLVVAGLSVEVANSLSQAFLGQGIGPADATNVMSTLVLTALTGGSIFFILIGLVIAVMAVMLLAVYVIRVAMIVVLIAGAPVALACHALPQTEGLAQMWWRALGACLGIQVAQSLVLVTALRVFFGSDGSSTLGLSVSGGLIDLLVIACLLWLLLRIPTWASRAAFSRRGSSTGRAIKSFVIYKVLRRAASAGAL